MAKETVTCKLCQKVLDPMLTLGPEGFIGVAEMGVETLAVRIKIESFTDCDCRPVLCRGCYRLAVHLALDGEGV